LRAVTSVDGQSVSLDPALSGASPQELRARLLTLAAERPATVGQASAAREEAAKILRDQRFQKSPIPASIGLTTDNGGGFLSGVPVAVWVAVGVVVLALAALLASRTLRRLEPAARPPSGSDPGSPALDPAALDREADAAESRGAFSEAVRLRFRAGLLGLGDRRAIDLRPSLRTAEVSRKLRSPEFDSLAATFERVAYGGLPAGSTDAAAARDGWRRVLSGVGGR
jgi:hypothetical protein